MTRQHELPAGRFSSWLQRTREALAKGNGITVPCGECTACCRSSYFIHIKPDEKRTLARIPAELQFSAPGLPAGTVLLGYDENGKCPMLIDDKCSIYEHRPLTCRSYDCRIFPAAGIAAIDDKALITRQIQRWKFDYLTIYDRNQKAAIHEAAVFLQTHRKDFPAEFVPRNITQLAILAITVYDVFYRYHFESGKSRITLSNTEIAKAVIEAHRRFEADMQHCHTRA